jgi:dTDP-4-amino-4,6-dideoxygalactose transaminase
MAAPAEVSARLAIDGGVPVRANAFAPWPSFSEEEVDAVTAVLRSGKINYWTGEIGRQFEREFAALTGCPYAVALANGSVALELALYTLGIGSGDEVVVPSRTFIASASCAALRGATPVMADIDRESQNLTAGTVRAVLSPRTRAIIAVHLAGWPCDMDPILGLAAERGLKVIEDCAQAIGATYKGRPVGSMGDVGAFSFCQDKIVTTGGEGGMVTTNDPELWSRAWSYKDHGKSYDAVYHRAYPAGFRWLHESFGTNWRLTEMQSALGLVQLRQLQATLEKRRRLAGILTAGFAPNPALRVTQPPIEIVHSYYKYYVFIRPERLREGWTRDRVMEAMNAEGIPCQVGSCSEVYLEKAFPSEMRPPLRLTVARELGETSLMFLVHPTLADEDMHDTVRAVEKVMQAASIS